MGFIYKITNTKTNKCYIGETYKPVQQRWNEHINLAKKGEGCPALRDAINTHGLENFTFEVILTCSDEERFEKEIEMIKKYNSQVPNGYNILPGGICGGGFIGKKHSPETIEKLKVSGKKFREENPNHFDTYREKHKEAMKNIDISSAVKNSEKYQKALKEGRIGGAAHKDGTVSEETKKKISETVKKYFEENAKNHRKVMAKAVGRPVVQYTEEGEFVNEFISISEAARQNNIPKSTVQRAVSKDNHLARGYVWKYKPQPEPIKNQPKIEPAEPKNINNENIVQAS